MLKDIREDCKDEVVRRVDNGKRRDIMGDRGGKKDKEKGQKQNSEKQQQKAKNKVERQPKRKP
jgi:hypothetical protein